MADRGLDSWTEGLSARERVRQIATTLTQPRSVEWVRKEANVSSWQTAKDELEMLVEFEQVQTIEVDGNTKYTPNYQRRYFSELAALINDHTREELREQIADIQDEIDEWKAEFDVDSRAALESTLASDDLTSEEIRTRNRILREWDRREDNKQLVEHALELYDDARALHPDDTNSFDSSHPVSQ
jgi:hypothetical protein